MPKRRLFTSAELTLLQSQLQRVLQLHLPTTGQASGSRYSFFGTYPASWFGAQLRPAPHSKLRHNAALYFSYAGPKPKRGPAHAAATKGSGIIGRCLNLHSLCSRPVAEGRFCHHYHLEMTVWLGTLPTRSTSSSWSKPVTHNHKTSHVVLFQHRFELVRFCADR